MEKETTKEVIVGLGVEKNGHVIIDTEAKEIPTEIVQQILDALIGKLAHVKLDELVETRRALRAWRLLAILASALLLITLFKMKGII